LTFPLDSSFPNLMSEAETLPGYAAVTEPITVRIEGILPGPIERACAWLTVSDLRRRWLAAGEMELRIGGRVDLIWRNDELAGHKEARPEGADAEHRMENVITQLEAPRLLGFGWGEIADLTFELEPAGRDVRLTITHRRLPSREMMTKVALAGTPISTCWWRSPTTARCRRSGAGGCRCARNTTSACRSSGAEGMGLGGQAPAAFPRWRSGAAGYWIGRRVPPANQVGRHRWPSTWVERLRVQDLGSARPTRNWATCSRASTC
jgi:uncharacterized protein YndB with AHSA1/START domain